MVPLGTIIKMPGFLLRVYASYCIPMSLFQYAHIDNDIIYYIIIYYYYYLLIRIYIIYALGLYTSFAMATLKANILDKTWSYFDLKVIIFEY